jgi:glycosyltransferase involved in cell wall biosynthesis
LSEISTSVPIEAMACGKPVVATDTGTAGLLQIDGTNGLVVPPGNPRKLGEAIVEMLRADEEDRLAIAKTNREIVKKVFGYSSWARQIKRLHASVVGERIA